MGISISESAFVVGGSQSISLSSIINISGAGNPQYIVVAAVDREEYTAGATGATGSFVGNGHTDALTVLSASAKLDGASIVFTYNASTGQYINSTYGNLSQVVYHSSSSMNDMTQIAVYGTNNVNDTAAGGNFINMQAIYGTTDYIGSATVATQPTFTGPIASNATPNSIVAAAGSFVGKVWNNEGCWALASTIAAEAGVSLPASTCFSGTPVGNGEWFVAFNGGAAGNSGVNWQSLLKAGEFVTIPGHITTVVSGSGSTAMLIDNASFGNNAANDGSSADIIIQKAFSAGLEFTGVQASGVAIYELDCPTVSAIAPTGAIKSAALSSLFYAADPNNKPVVAYQVYDANPADTFTVNGKAVAATSAASAITATALTSVTFNDMAGASDTIMVRAENSLGYWGDWQAQTVNGGTSNRTTTSILAPVVAAHEANQTVLQGKSLSLSLAGEFADPQHQILTYAAKLASGAALPNWLSFNASTDTFNGTAPATAGTLNVVVTATDASGLTATDAFNIMIIAAPTRTQTGAQTMTIGTASTFTLPSNTFADPNGQAMTYTASQSNGQALPSWLKFNATTDSFSGTPPSSTAASLTVSVTAKDPSGLTAVDTFKINFMNPTTHVYTSGITIDASGADSSVGLIGLVGQSVDVHHQGF